MGRLGYRKQDILSGWPYTCKLYMYVCDGEACVCVCVCVCVQCHMYMYVVTKVFLGKLPATGEVWVVEE